jgi:hypothetical protein
MQVCGGEMEKLGDHFYLVGGHDFAGLYNQTGPPQFTQTYINEVRRFKITDTPSELSIADYSIFHDEENLHRRDFTLAPVIQSDGTEGLCLYGGVFRPDEDLPYYNPVYISEDGTAAVDTAVEQLFSQYTCPAVPIYDSLDGSVYTLFFAGLSAHFIENGAVEYDERVPFIKDISVFQRRADGSSAEYVLPQRFDEFLGTNMIYVPAADSPQFGHGILHLQAMDEPTFVGYLYGGIKAEIPNFTPSVASNRLFKIYLVPKAVAAAEEVAAAPPALQVFPNPFSNGSALEFRHFLPVQRVDLLRPDGQMLNTFDQPSDNGFMFLNNYLEGLPAGLYFLNVVAGERMSVVKLVKQ